MYINAPVEPEAPKQMITVGLGVGVAPDFEGSEDYEAVPLPLIMVRFTNHMSVLLAGNRLEVDLLPDPKWKLGVAAEFLGKRDDDVENDVVGLLDEVDASFMVGPMLGFENRTWKFGVVGLSDMSDSSDGTIVRLSTGYKKQLNRGWRFSINAFTTWADDDYMESYFGIDGSNSLRSGLSMYEAESGIKDVGITIPVFYDPCNYIGVVCAVGYKRLLGDAEDSPIVNEEGNENQLFAGFAITYTFQ